MIKKSKRKSGQVRMKTATIAWLAGGLGVVAIAGLLAYAIIQGEEDATSGTLITETPDPRLAGLTPAATISIEAGDAGQATGTYFDPAQVTATAGEATEIVLTNAGSVAHNIHLSGADKKYDTTDDWVGDVITPGEEVRLLFKIDERGSYPFRCDLHPTTQTGTLTLE